MSVAPVIRQNHAHRVKSIGALGPAILCDPILGNLGEFSLLGGRDMLFRICGISAERLHLDEDQRSLMKGDEIELAQRTAEITGENTMTGPLQEFGGRLFPEIAKFVARL